MRILDLFCGAGGATRGYQQAGFRHVTGVDINPQPNYCGDQFIQADVIDLLTNGHPDFDGWYEYDAIHASPPCQTYSTLKTVRTRHVEPLVERVRGLLSTMDVPYVIENVVGSPLIDPVRICGTTVGCVDDETELRRHRLFEANWPLVGAPCNHSKDRKPVGVYGHLGHHDRPNRPESSPTGPHGWKAGKGRARRLMGMEWGVTDAELGEAIPPAYTKHIGRQLLDHLGPD